MEVEIIEIWDVVLFSVQFYHADRSYPHALLQLHDAGSPINAAHSIGSLYVF